jgi:hypothetical protein
MNFAFTILALQHTARGIKKPALDKNQLQIFENDVARISRITTTILNGVEMMLVRVFTKLQFGSNTRSNSRESATRRLAKITPWRSRVT